MRARAQELVPDPSFENLRKCPVIGEFILDSAFTHWYSTGETYSCCTCFDTPLFNQQYYCQQGGFGSPANTMGRQYPYEGLNYVGVLAYIAGAINPSEPINDTFPVWGLYIGTRLLHPLEAGRSYGVEAHINLSDSSVLGYGGLRFKFTETKPDGGWLGLPILYNPHYRHPTVVIDTVNWVRVQFTYIAQGGEEYLNLGWAPYGDLNEEGKPDTIPSGGIDRGVRCQNPNLPPWDQDHQRKVWYYIDGVSVMDLELGMESLGSVGFTLFPNPSTGLVQAGLEGTEGQVLWVRDVVGRLVHSQRLQPGNQSLDLRHLGAGLYEYGLQGLPGQGKLVLAP